jgi:hypothetical protein
MTAVGQSLVTPDGTAAVNRCNGTRYGPPAVIPTVKATAAWPQPVRTWATVSTGWGGYILHGRSTLMLPTLRRIAPFPIWWFLHSSDVVAWNIPETGVIRQPCSWYWGGPCWPEFWLHCTTPCLRLEIGVEFTLRQPERSNTISLPWVATLFVKTPLTSTSIEYWYNNWNTAK